MLGKTFLRLLTVFILAAAVGVSGAIAQQTSGRKVVSRVEPRYPDIARRMNLVGIVKIQVTINPEGSVKTAKLLGGSPVLADAALDAVKKWKFERTKDETTEIVSFSFKGL
jgi:protein TonB